MIANAEGLYPTEEGFTLYKPLLLPGVRNFLDLFQVLCPWSYETMNHRNGVPGPDRPADLEFDGNYLTPFCAVSQPGRENLAVRPTELLLDALRGELITMGDHLAWKVIYHPGSDRCLVIVDHNQIIGSRWLAYVNPATVPTPGQIR